jgi:anaphase-promoting complex subunit 1
MLANQFSYAEKLFASVARNALNVTMSGLCLVLAGSGNIEYFQKLKSLHEKSSTEILYGSHMAASMSIGLLFLASGSATVGSSNKAIATLFCSFFPLYPSSPIDNRFHLQALRHLWVLAVDRRCVIARDVETGDIVNVPIEITVEKAFSTPQNVSSPTILPPFDWIKSIKVLGPRYWELDLAFEDILDKDRNVTIWVQRKSQHLSYSDARLVLLNLGSRWKARNSGIIIS